MRVTRRYWTTVGVAVLLAVWALVLEHSALLIGTTGLGAWVVARQYLFVQTVRRAASDLTVAQRLDRTRVTAEETTLGSLVVQCPEPIPVSLTVRSDPPIGSAGTSVSCQLHPGETSSETQFEISWPVAGQFEFDQPSVLFRDRLGLFTQRVSIGPAPSVTVEPNTPRDIHVGKGGDRLESGIGEHETGGTGSGLTPAQIRQYVPGDTVRQIDWKATARFNEPHIREFEAENEFETLLVVDHRAKMATGQQGATKLALARQVALGFVDTARELGDPLGYYTVGDAGITSSFQPSSDEEQYRAISRQLRTLEPTDSPSADPTGGVIGPSQARQTATALPSEGPMSDRLRPFFETAETYVKQLTDRPLFETIRTAMARQNGTVRLIVVTDDEGQTELRESIKLASDDDGQVLVFLTPTVLYERYGHNDLDTAYQRYTEFETFRRTIASSPDVEAFEIGPSDRLATVLAAGSRQHKQEAGR